MRRLCRNQQQRCCRNWETLSILTKLTEEIVKKFLTAVLAISTPLLFSNSVSAAPQFRWGFQGAYFHIFATNPENKQYNCNYSYTFTYSDFGEKKSRTESGTFSVYSNAKDLEV